MFQDGPVAKESESSEATCKTNKYTSAVGVGTTDLNWCPMIL